MDLHDFLLLLLAVLLMLLVALCVLSMYRRAVSLAESTRYRSGDEEGGDGDEEEETDVDCNMRSPLVGSTR